MEKVFPINLDAGSQQNHEPRVIGELIMEFLHSNHPLAQLLRQGIEDNICTPLEDWVTGAVVEDMLDVSTRRLQTLRSNGSLPYSKLGGKVYYKRADVERLLESGYNGAKLPHGFTSNNLKP